MKLEAFSRIYIDKKKIVLDYYDGTFTEIYVYDKKTGSIDHNPDEKKLRELFKVIVDYLSNISKIGLNQVAQRHAYVPSVKKGEIEH